MYQPNPNSKTSQKRKNRGFVSLEKSSRKHRRAARRLAEACVIKGTTHKPGTKTESVYGWMHTAGGALRYH